MTELIKQRLVGMLIVVIAGVVFIPDLLDGQKQTSKSDFKKIPEVPEFNKQPKLTEFPSEEVSEAVSQVPESDEIASDDLMENESEKSDSGFKPQESGSRQSTSASNDQDSPKQTVASVSDINKDNEDTATNSSNVNVNSGNEAGAETESVSQPQSIEQKVARSTVPQKPSKFEKPLYILQLGSFKHKENVTTLRNKLKQAGYETYTKPVKTKSGVLSKVYIGPEVNKETLEKAQVKLKELTGLAGKITRFEPTN